MRGGPRHLVALPVLAALALSGSARVTPQSSTLRAGQARIRYLEHAGWAVETASHFLVFDYARAWPRDRAGPRAIEDGWLGPDDLAGRRAVVFISHAHGDHYDPAILRWANRADDLTFVFGWPGPPGPDRVMVTDRRPRSVGLDLTVSAVQHTFDRIPESAFLVETDGLVIYHSGDHGTVTDPPNPAFVENITALAGRVERVDLAFVSIFGGGSGSWVNAGDRYTIETLRPRVVFPMHSGGREREYAAFADEAGRLAPAVTFAAASHPGHLFHYRDGHVD